MRPPDQSTEPAGAIRSGRTTVARHGRLASVAHAWRSAL